MWQLFRQAKTWQTKPSEILGVTDEWDAYCLDRAVWLFGTELENAIESINEKNPKSTNTKRERLVRKWLRIEQEYRAPQAVATSGNGSLGDRVREEAGLKTSGVPENDLLGGVRRGVRRR